MEHSLVRFTPATERDVDTILELRRTIWSSTYRGIYPDSMIDDFDTAWHREKELQRIRHPDYRVYLIAMGDHPVGYLTTRKGEEVLLQSLYVLAGYQHRGIGRRAFDYMREYCAEIGTNFFICHCVPENGKARAFYERMGGRIIGADMENEESWMNSVIYRFDVKGKAMNENLLGKCGFYCGCCPTYRSGGCKGCLEEHQTGDCFTRDCVLARGIDCCGACEQFPCDTILTKPCTTVLDKDWLRWKKESNTNRQGGTG